MSENLLELLSEADHEFEIENNAKASQKYSKVHSQINDGTELEPDRLAALLRNYSRTLLSEGLPEQALELINSSAERFELNAIEQAGILLVASDCYRNLSDNDARRTVLNRISELLGDIADSGFKEYDLAAGLARAWGLFYLDKGEFSKARDQLLEAEAHALKSGDNVFLATIQSSLGDVFFYLCDYEKAIECRKKSFELLVKNGMNRSAAHCLNSLGHTYRYVEQEELAQQTYADSLAMMKELDDRPGIACCNLNMGGVAAARGDNEKALQCFGDALDTFIESGDLLGQAGCLESLGQLSLNTGNTDLAKEYFQRSLEKASEIGDVQCRARCSFNLALLAYSQGELEDARDSLRLSMKFRDESQDKKGLAECFLLQARINEMACQWKDAEKSYMRAFDVCREIGYRYLAMLTMKGLADCRMELGMKEEAMDMYSEAMAMAEEMGDHETAGEIKEKIG